MAAQAAFVASVNEATLAVETFNAIMTFSAIVADGATGSDGMNARPLWEVITDFAPTSWGVINDSESSDWETIRTLT
jgi:hypothetical protein